MLLDPQINTIQLTKGPSSFEFLPTGDVFQFLSQDILINQFLGNTMDGSINNIYLRIYENGRITQVVPLVGNHSASTFSYNTTQAKWSGTVQSISYEIIFTPVSESIWFWTINLNGSGQVVDLLYGQDISISNKGGTLTNELYMCQYIDHKILEGPSGYVVSSRQNQGQSTGNPYLQQGSVNLPIVGFSTDSMQFFGKSYKLTNTPALLDQQLPNVNYQYEQAYIALQTEKISITEPCSGTFYGIFKPNYATAVETIDFSEELSAAYALLGETPIEPFTSATHPSLKSAYGQPLASLPLTVTEINTLFPEQKMIEEENDQLLSFFTPYHTHVVLMAKEVEIERPHGHIITSGISSKHLNTELITSTNYMYGIFNAQIVVGNTSMNKLLSTTRGLLNQFKNSGQRIYIKLEETYHLLTLPAVYELGVNYAKWYYKVPNDMIIITSYTAHDRADVILEVKSEQGMSYEFIVTNQLVMGGQEFENTCDVIVNENQVTIYPGNNELLKNTYPNIHYTLTLTGATLGVSDDRIFYEDDTAHNPTLLTLSVAPTTQFELVIAGRLFDAAECYEPMQYHLDKEIEKFNTLYNNLTCQFKLSLPAGKSDVAIEKLNETVWWYTHNAMVHYAVPHGLEQPGGAAWGTRDVCQGPFEYFLATQHFSLTREIIVEVYKHQFLESGEWPQWFMFDAYNMQQDDCHGDVVFWPLKILGDYLKATGDYSILDEEVIYRHTKTCAISETPESIFTHMKRAVESIKKRFLFDTALISYDGGDWDDTLQPASKDLKEKLVSAWTVALAYQVTHQFGEVLTPVDAAYAHDMKAMADAIKSSFTEHLIKDDVIAGFAYCESPDHIDYMLHPSDQKTGIKYRLLPMTRSIISNLISKEQAHKNVDVIKEHLKCPDGVRLMNHPARYKGGVSEIFQRAEQASNVGREISLQYVHAHIRFIEAMAMLGNAEDAWEALMVINPINIKDHVPNAMRRQSNAYFSSSEGNFNTRYEFDRDFHKLRTGDVAVKGGWRIYSSGPGIYLNQLISNVLGLRILADEVVIDPVLPSALDGLRFDYQYNAKPIQLIYHLDQTATSAYRITIDGIDIPTFPTVNSYRSGGIRISKDIFEKHITNCSCVHIYFQ